MFSLLGKVVCQYWPAVLAAWCVVLALGWLFAPAWEAVTHSGEVDFLPEGSPSRRGDALLRDAFPDRYADSSVVVVLWREGELRDEDRRFVEDQLTPPLEEMADSDESETPIVRRVRTLADTGSGALLVSADRRATLVVVELTTPFIDSRNPAVVAQVESVVADLRENGKIPAGLGVAVTGSAAAGRDLVQAQGQSVRAVELWTVVVIVALLLVLYRAPLAALLPLATVVTAVQTSLSLLALLGGAGLLALDRDVRVFVTVLVYGAGVDYCLFLIARYREELDAGAAPQQAVAATVGQAGHAVVASAATVIFGVGALAFARFGKIHDAGLAIPVALTVTLAAALTLCPALLRLSGRLVFWPQLNASGFLGRGLPDVWQSLAPALRQRPASAWLACVVLMAPFAAVALARYNDQNFNPISELPASAPSAAGSRAAAKHFPPGELAPVTILVQDDGADFASREGLAQIARLTDRLVERKDELGLADVRSVAKPLGITPAAEEGLADVPKQGGKSELRRRAISHYVSEAGEWKQRVTRLELTLKNDPVTERGFRDLDRVEAAIRDALPDALQGARLSASGTAPSVRDLAAVKRSDQWRIQILVPAVVFALLLLVFRRVVVSLYLVLTVLFSYLTTLGATYLLFWLLGHEHFAGLDWKVPVFLFTILVAVGEDYNVFLITRVKEEQDRHGPLEGITTALVRTGRVISACGFLMAGTFASLLSGSLVDMKQLGFALALGILLDTLVVRPVLVPAFLILLQTGRLGWLGRRVALDRTNSPQNRAA